ncbi:c-type cytochrome [bacterium]|nr:c-type cytochrome [bacterium]
MREPRAWVDYVQPDFPFFSSALDARKAGDGLPVDNLTPRGIILNLGNDCWACFDTDLLRVSTIWKGDAVSGTSMSQVSYHHPGVKAIEGQEHLPQMIGAPWLANGIYPGWQAGANFSLTDPRTPAPDKNEVGRGPLSESMGRFRAIHLTAGGARLDYDVAGAHVSEWVESREENGQPVVQRRFRLSNVPQTLWLMLGRRPDSLADQLKLTLSSDQFDGRPAAELNDDPQGICTVKINPTTSPVEFQVAISTGSDVKTWSSATESRSDALPAARWPETLTTQAVLAPATNTYVVDNIPLPFDNPWRRNIRLADLGFFSDGRAAAVTFDGDVWIISGLRGNLKEVTWKRFTSGLHEPQSLCIRDDQIFVFDRNGIWRLRDTDGNGEADMHELFSDAFAQTAETREYAQSMKLAPDGSFIIGKGGIQMTTLGKNNGSVLRISPDGKHSEVLAYGLRSPYLGVNPKTGLITASDQQGNYVPTTPLHIIRDHQFYGFLSKLLPEEKYPAPIADPLTWIPYPVNASGANQVWLTNARMGPLNDAFIHFGYYRPEIFVVRLNDRASRLQAAVLSLDHDLPFPPFDGAVNPIDGQLYFTGFQIFGSLAPQISGLARLRYTGGPTRLPREIIPADQGILVKFDVALDERTATDPANYSAGRWQYQRTYNYGSANYKLDGTKGQETMTPSSAYLSRDRRSVFIGIRDMKPVMQMRLGWTLRTADGREFTKNAYFTPYELTHFNPESEGFKTLTVDLTRQIARAEAATPITAKEGQRLAGLMGCVACHSADGSTVGKAGPSWKGLFESRVALAGGQEVTADENYLRESIKNPPAKVVRGYEHSETAMPSYEGVVTEPQIEALIRYIETIK